eukprot:gene18870-22572_t
MKKVKPTGVKVNTPEENENRFSSVLGSILKKEPKSDTPILAKYKKADEAIAEEISKQRKQKDKYREKSLLTNKDHRPIEVLITAEERDLMKTAKRGAIKLFNAVAKHQQDTVSSITMEDPTKLTKGQFLDKLKKSPAVVKEEVKAEGQWEALNEDYLLDTKSKQWDSYNGEDQ